MPKVTTYHATYKHINVKLRVFLAGYTVAKATCYVEKMTKLCSLMIGHSFDTNVVASKYKHRKVVETTT